MSHLIRIWQGWNKLVSLFNQSVTVLLHSVCVSFFIQKQLMSRLTRLEWSIFSCQSTNVSYSSTPYFVCPSPYNSWCLIWWGFGKVRITYSLFESTNVCYSSTPQFVSYLLYTRGDVSFDEYLAKVRITYCLFWINQYICVTVLLYSVCPFFSIDISFNKDSARLE